MPHLSAKGLQEKEFLQIYEKLISIMLSCKSKKELAGILEVLLTDTEKIMISKRLAVISMFEKQDPFHVIEETLHMSPSTIAKMSLGYEIGKYRHIVKIAKKSDISLANLINDILTIVPSRRELWRRVHNRKF